jgi:formylglycine-generating enzyme required for sulfatase activity
MSQIFISHSSSDNAQALAIRRWLAEEGFGDVFLDLHPEGGIKPGEQWEEALRDAAGRCEAVIFLVSRAWLASEWCRDEFRLARHLRKHLLVVLIEDIAVSDLPRYLTQERQVVTIAPIDETRVIPVALPESGRVVDVAIGSEGLRRLKLGLAAAGLDPNFFAWPPGNDPNRPPYRGLLALEAEDAGIFFGREAPLLEALDRLRGLRDASPPRLLVILGASGAGKSSLLRAGLVPRIARDSGNFFSLPVVRPARGAISGETGLIRALEGALATAGLRRAYADIRAAVAGGAVTLRPLLLELIDQAGKAAPADRPIASAPLVVLPIDQGEELFVADGATESESLLALLGAVLKEDAPAVLALVTIRSDSYGQLQSVPALDGIRQETMSLPPMPRGAYQVVIEGPAARLRGGPRALRVDPALTQALLAEVESGGGRDALPLIAFTLERLYLEFGGRGRLMLGDYEALGRIGGAIEAAVERALRAADADARIPRDRGARLALLRRGLVPWLAGIDAESGRPRRRIARLSEIPSEARPLIDRLTEERLLATDVAENGEVTIEPAHETLLRQWGQLQGWLAEDAGLLGVLEGVKRATRDWAANAKDPAWLAHATSRLAAAERLWLRRDLSAHLEPTDIEYLAACRARERAATGARRRNTAALAALFVLVIGGLSYAGWTNRSLLAARTALLRETMWPMTLAPMTEHALKPRDEFRECAYCPVMVVVIPSGPFLMGSSDDRATGWFGNERPRHQVSIARSFAVSRFEVTFEEWDVCALLGGCQHWPSDQDWGRGTRPVIDIDWDDAQQYVAWLARRTGKPYRLLTEAEWEYAARADRDTTFAWGEEIGRNLANCDGCGSKWDNRQTAPVGSFSPNAFGLYDMHGNAWEWVEDCYKDSYEGAPSDGSALSIPGCARHVLRGGSWYNHPDNVRAAVRNWFLRGVPSQSRNPDQPDAPPTSLGLRVARSLALQPDGSYWRGAAPH